MSLIICEDCGKKVSSKAKSCPECGCPIESKDDNVMIKFPVWKGQLFNNNCYVYNMKTNEIISECKQGETVTFSCYEPTEIYIVCKGCFGKPSTIVKNGDKFIVEFRGFGKIYLSKVDVVI